MKKIVLALALVASFNAMAAAPAAAPAADCDGLKVATGPAGKGYSKLFADMQKVCGGTVHICEVQTGGGLDNLNSLSTNEADIGLAQVDTLADMKSGDENISSLQAVMPLNFNYLHVVTAANGFTVAGEKKLGFLKGDSKQVVVQRFSDLRGQRVAVVGSAALLGRKLDRTLGYNIQFIDVDKDDAAFQMVKSGQVAAAFTLSGWPSGTVGALKQDSGLSLVPFDVSISAPYVVRPINYKGLGVYNSNALAIPNVLLTRPFKGAKVNDVAALKSCISSHLVDLQEGSYSPGWKEIKSLENTYDIPKFAAGASAAAAKVVAKGKK